MSEGENVTRYDLQIAINEARDKSEVQMRDLSNSFQLLVDKLERNTKVDISKEIEHIQDVIKDIKHTEISATTKLTNDLENLGRGMVTLELVISNQLVRLETKVLLFVSAMVLGITIIGPEIIKKVFG